MSRFILLLAGVVAVSCHLCMLNPPQRSSLGPTVNGLRSHDCYRVIPPCGAKPAENSTTYLQAGSVYTIIFQKNLDHIDYKTPGWFTVSFGVDEQSFVEVARVKDRGEKNLHLFSEDIIVPPVMNHSKRIVQVAYVTNNASMAPPVAIYYQCSDVIIY
ncbi:hypothetical protein EB796_023937 [Bugula neritina]|uniref:Uncharacterized protein n=1 Tax=Bugula neritina TaxID=10212 RepID=A0A7J7IVZ7_BUGNE|nr:hypothetical protein EB796_023937 [Bugula neritina]